MEFCNLAQSHGTRDRRDILAFLVTFQDFPRHCRALFVNATVLENVPHIILCICSIRYVKGHTQAASGKLYSDPSLPLDHASARFGTSTSRLPLVCICDTSPAFSICSISRAARL